MLKLLALMIVLLPTHAWGMSPAYKDAVERSYNELLYAHPSIKYVWGADKPYEGKADCSGLIYGIWKKAAVPGLKRTTALFMQQGKDGWGGRDVEFNDLDSTDLLWWTWKNQDGSLTNPTRPHGHIGVVVLDRSTGLLEVYHASTSKKAAVVQQIRGKMLTDISSKKRMIHGEKIIGSKGK